MVQVTRTKPAAAQGDVAQPSLRNGRGWGGARDTAVTPSTAFTVFKSSEDDTCVKNSLKVKVQYGVLEADKQGSFVRPRDSCLLDFIGKCT